MRVIVVGAGVVGLTCAVRLLEAGHRVDVVARDLPLETTSAVAAAIWYPYRALPRDKVTAGPRRRTPSSTRWPTPIRSRACGWCAGPRCSPKPQPDPWWAGAVPGLDRETTLPDGYVDGWTFATPVVEMPVYLPWLAGRVAGARRHPHPDEPQGAARGRRPGRQLLGPRSRGCSARTARWCRSAARWCTSSRSGLDRWWLDADGPTYVVPRSHDIVVGGTDDEGEWSRTPDPDAAREILARGSRWCRSSAAPGCCGTRSGCGRCGPPYASSGRATSSTATATAASGVTLSWGVADEVVSLAVRQGACAGEESCARTVALAHDRAHDLAGAQKSRCDGSSRPRRAS